MDLFDRHGVSRHDPSDPRWNEITHENGDSNQNLINRLVAEEHEGLRQASCVVFHLEGSESLAARSELGFLAGRGTPTFVHVDPATKGRNYVWALVELYESLERCETLEEACRRAIQAVRP